MASPLDTVARIQEDEGKKETESCVGSRGGLRRVKCDGASEVAGGEERTSSLAESWMRLCSCHLVPCCNEQG